MGALKGGAPGPAGMPLGSYLAHIGVQGYGAVEPVVLAALISGDPLLLVGRAGTGKTFLLNSLSEVLGLEHRHYNASMISFDDLVGFPAPDGAGGVAFLRTPAAQRISLPLLASLSRTSMRWWALAATPYPHLASPSAFLWAPLRAHSM